MPASTPTGITYPCGGENLTCESMATYATTLQTSINATQALVTSALSPPRVLVTRRSPSPQLVAAGATTLFSFTEEMYDTAAMWDIAAPTAVIIPSSGTYLVALQAAIFAFPTTLTSLRLAILLNGVEIAYQKHDEEVSSGFYISAMPISLVAANQITASVLFTGTGNATFTAQMSVIRISTT